MASREVEYKFELNARGYRTLLDRLESVPSERVHQKNIFFDTSEHFLKSKKWALRLREEGQKRTLCCKGPAKVKNGLFDRPELEHSLPASFDLPEKWKASEFSGEFFDFLIKSFGDLPYSSFLSFKNTRIKSPWKNWFLELDCTEVKGEKFYELELECAEEEGIGLELQKWLRNLNVEFKLGKISKLEKAMSLV